MMIFHGVMFCSTAPINGTYPPLAHLSHLVFDDVLHNLHHGPNFALKPVQLYLATRPPGHPPQWCHVVPSAVPCRAEIHGGALLRSRRFSTSLETRASSRVIRPEKSGVSSRPSRKGVCVCAFEHWLQMSMSLVKWCEISGNTEGIKSQSVLKVLRLAPMANLTSIQNDLRRVAGKPSQLSSIPATASRFLPSPAVFGGPDPPMEVASKVPS